MIATVDEHKQTFEHYATKLQMTYAMRLVEGMNEEEEAKKSVRVWVMAELKRRA